MDHTVYAPVAEVDGSLFFFKSPPMEDLRGRPRRESSTNSRYQALRCYMKHEHHLPGRRESDGLRPVSLALGTSPFPYLSQQRAVVSTSWLDGDVINCGNAGIMPKPPEERGM